MSTEGAAIAAAVTEGMNTKNTSETGTRRGRANISRRATLDLALSSTKNTTGIIGKGLVMRSTSALPPLANTASAMATTSGTGGSEERKTDDRENSFNYLGNVDLDDVPKLLDGDFDPFMVIEAQRVSERLSDKPTTCGACACRRQIEAEAGRWIRRGSQALWPRPFRLPPAMSRPSTGAGFSVAFDRYRAHLRSRGRQGTREADACSRTNYSETSQYTSFSHYPGTLMAQWSWWIRTLVMLIPQA